MWTKSQDQNLQKCLIVINQLWNNLMLSTSSGKRCYVMPYWYYCHCHCYQCIFIKIFIMMLSSKFQTCAFSRKDWKLSCTVKYFQCDMYFVKVSLDKLYHEYQNYKWLINQSINSLPLEFSSMVRSFWLIMMLL